MLEYSVKSNEIKSTKQNLLYSGVSKLKARTLLRSYKACKPHNLIGLSRHEFALYKDIIEHGLNVSRYARMLFEDLFPLHGLGELWLSRLLLAAQYHDIGTIDGEKAHHKHSYTRIKNDKSLAIPESDREIVALIARYHRRALPHDKHPEFACLDVQTKEALCKVASIIRLADALDCQHEAHIKKVRVIILEKQIRLDCLTDKCISLEKIRVEKKGDLFQRTFQKDIVCKLI